MDMTISSDTTYELTFTVANFNVVPIDKIYDMLGQNFFTNIVVAAHQPDDNNKNTHYHAMFSSSENIPIPSDYENKSSQEQAARRNWKKKIGSIEGVTRIHYGRCDHDDKFMHYILVKSLVHQCSEQLIGKCDKLKQELYCAQAFQAPCKHCAIKNKVSKKQTESLTQFELIMRDIKKDNICQFCTDKFCHTCYNGEVIQRKFINYYLKKKKQVPIGRVAEMLLSAKAVLAPTPELFQTAEDDIMQAINAKMQNNLKCY